MTVTVFTSGKKIKNRSFDFVQYSNRLGLRPNHDLLLDIVLHQSKKNSIFVQSGVIWGPLFQVGGSMCDRLELHYNIVPT